MISTGLVVAHNQAVMGQFKPIVAFGVAAHMQETPTERSMGIGY